MATFTIGKKLFLGVGALVLFTFALGATALISLNSVNDKLHAVVDSRLKKVTIVQEMRTDTAELVSTTRSLIVRGMIKDDAMQRTNIEHFSTLTDSLNASINTLNGMNLVPEMRQDVKEFKQLLDGFPAAKDSILESFKTGDVTGALSTLDNTVLPTQKRLNTNLEEMLKLQDRLLASDTEAAHAAATTSAWVSGILLIFTLCVAAIVAFVVRQINSVLRASVLELAESSEQIAAAATQVSSSSQSLAQGSSEQAATIEETSSASIEINSMAMRNTENSKQTASIVTGSEAGFQKANESLGQMVVAMEGISTSSQKISKIIKVIDEIAFQTNILALNAAVEAARAGEAGMGFAVVADEVRSLAQRCAQAAKDTTDLIEDSMNKSNSGMTKVDQVAVAIRDITAQSAQIKTLVDEINLGSIEQSRGIDQISSSIGQMEQVTQNSAANAEETAAAAEQLSAQAKSMKDTVGRIRAMVQSDSAQHDVRTFSSNPRTPTTLHLQPRSSAGRTQSPATLPRPNVQTRVTTAVKSKAGAVAAGGFPMDEDFKEF